MSSASGKFMADLSSTISRLQTTLANARQAIEATKRCSVSDEVSNLSSTASTSEKPGNRQHFAQIKADIHCAKALIAQVVKCKGLDLQNVPSVLNTDNGSKKRPSADDSTQTSPPKRAKSTSQTEITADFFQAVENVRKKSKENDASHARWSLQQLLKFSATERERVGLEAMVQFTKMLFGMSDEEFGNYYNRYLNGAGVEELRKEWALMKEPPKPEPICPKCDHKSDQDESLDDDVFLPDNNADKNEITALRCQLRTSKMLTLHLIKILEDTMEVEESSQESVSRILGTVGQYTEMLNGRRHSA